MKNTMIVAALLLLGSACKDGRRALPVQERTVNGFTLRLQQMPAADKEMFGFRLHIGHADGGRLKHTDDVRFNYGLDSLFAFVQGTDTLRPMDVIRVANGNVSGMEFLLLFPKPADASGLSGQLIYKDWLFTNQLLTFPSFKQDL